MQAANIKSYRALADKAGVSRWQIQQLRTGNIEKMRVEALAKISAALQIQITDLLEQFSNTLTQSPHPPSPVPHPPISQAHALQTLETWLTQWPTIAKRAQTHPDLAAAKLLPFIRPVEQLMREWNVESIATVDEQIPYDPIWHQLTKGSAEPGELVQVTHTGQTHHGKLLHRAKVKPI